jgi:hypothetical protein
MKTLTIKASTAFAQAIFATKHDPRDFSGAIFAVLNGSGWAIPHGAFTDGDDERTVSNLAKWIRRYAVRDAAPLGRPAEMTGGKRVNVYLDAASLARAAELGGGNVSEGIRAALKR